MREPVSVEDFRTLARRRLPRMIFDYLEGGADDEHGLRRNRAAFSNVDFVPRRLVDVSHRDLSTRVFGRTIAAPLVIAPTGLNALFWPRGDIELARAAAHTGIPFVLSTAANVSIEELAGEADGEHWFQLYVLHRSVADQMVQRARKSAYSTLVLTTDVVLNGKRERDMRNGFGLPLRYTPRVLLDGALHPRWSSSLLRHGVPKLKNFETTDVSDTALQAALMSRKMDASFNWEDLARLRDQWPGKLLVKGLSHPDDAAHCLALGADGVVLSNHGGRQLDDTISPLYTLQMMSRESYRGSELLLDSGVRRGSDVVKAVALGASAVMLGRATLYGLAADGVRGAIRVIEIIKDEIDRSLALLGCRSTTELGPRYITSAQTKKRPESCSRTKSLYETV